MYLGPPSTFFPHSVPPGLTNNTIDKRGVAFSYGEWRPRRFRASDQFFFEERRKGEVDDDIVLKSSYRENKQLL